ncbi:putative quinol monooxygenase [Methanobrevibacter curvatus]|nr:putative quinol monooxygenase [Methanobrevibacter curvatus]
MILVLAYMKLKEGKKVDLLEITKELIKKTRLENGNISYNLFNDSEDENSFVMVEQWESKDHLNAHMEIEHFKKFADAVGSILAEDLDIKEYDI